MMTYWQNVWRHREALYMLVWRDIAVRYRQTAVGATWAIVRPIVTMVVLTFVFKTVAGMASGDVPYPLLVFAGIITWQVFAGSLNGVGMSLVNNTQLVSKMSLPKILIPFSMAAVNVVDFVLASVVLTGLIVWYDIVPGWQILLLPVFVGLGLLLALGVGLCLAVINVWYRDVRHVIPFILQFGLYLSPVGFSSQSVPDAWQKLYDINPMVGVIEGVRWAIFDNPELDWRNIAWSTGVAVTGLIVGIHVFRRREGRLADVI